MTLAQQDSYLLNYAVYLLAPSPSTEGLYFFSSAGYKKETGASSVPISFSLSIE